MADGMSFRGYPRTIPFIDGGKRRYGSQIKECSCVVASVEYLSYEKLGNVENPVIQEDFTDVCNWELMWNMFRIKLIERLEAKDDYQFITKVKSYFENTAIKYGLLLHSDKYENQGGHASAVVDLTGVGCFLVIPQIPIGGQPQDPVQKIVSWKDIYEWKAPAYVDVLANNR